jgi:dTDP-glucose 4,6-dehydratase
MRCLVTGISGLMGSNVLEHLLVETDWEIVGLASWKHKGVPERIADSTYYQEHKERVTIITHDLQAPIVDMTARNIGPIDYIIHCAADSHVDRSIEDPVPFILNNVQVTLNMLEYIRKYPVKKFIQISTDEVYGPADAGYNHKEGEPHRPSNPYSASKSCQEDVCYAYWRTFKLPIIITNTMNLFSERQDPEKYVPMVIKRVLNGEKVTIHASAEGVVGSRYYLHARNQADALLFILNNIEPVEFGAGELARYNIVGEREVDNLELATLVALFAGKTLDYELVDFHSSRPGHDLRYALDGSKLAAAGWVAPIPFEDSLKRTVEWTLAHPAWLK